MHCVWSKHVRDLCTCRASRACAAVRALEAMFSKPTSKLALTDKCVTHTHQVTRYLAFSPLHLYLTLSYIRVLELYEHIIYKKKNSQIAWHWSTPRLVASWMISYIRTDPVYYMWLYLNRPNACVHTILFGMEASSIEIWVCPKPCRVTSAMFSAGSQSCPFPCDRLPDWIALTQLCSRTCTISTGPCSNPRPCRSEELAKRVYSALQLPI